MIEQYDKTRPGIELNADDVSESEPQRFELAESAIDSSSRSVLEPAPASLLELESNLEEKQESSSDISSESSDGVGFLHDFDKLMRRYSI